MNGMETIGERLKRERRANKLSQSELAASAGITKQGVSNIESGQTKNPEFATLEPMCRKLGISPKWLLTGTGPKKAGEPERILHLAEPVAGSYFNEMLAQAGSKATPIKGKQDVPLRYELVISRLENDIDALRYAVAALVTSMVVNRPAEALDAAETIRQAVPSKFRDQGFLHELLLVLEKASKR